METTLVTHEVNLGRHFNGWAECTSNKPKLLHVPFSHVLALLVQVGVSSTGYVAPFYLKQNIEVTWRLVLWILGMWRLFGVQ